MMSKENGGKDFFDLVKSIGESKSKQEEDRIITDEVIYLKKKVFESNTPKKKLKEIVVSSNQLEACAALSAAAALTTRDMVPALISEVILLLSHDMSAVRRRAVCTLHKFYIMDPPALTGIEHKVKLAMCDKDPSVMAAALVLLLALAKDSPPAYKDLITEHRLHNDYDYHRIPAPWTQMQIMRLMAVLGRGDRAASEGMYEVLAEAMRRADTGINVGYALVFEAVRTVTLIYPNTVLLDLAAAAVSRFMRSDSHNLKYMGIKGLAAIVEDHPSYALDHQMAVIDCLEDDDETLQRKTVDLLFRMTSARNVEFVVERMLRSLAGTGDEHFRTDLTSRVMQCAERFAPSPAWFVRTVVRLLEVAGDKVSAASAQTFLQLVAESGDKDGADDSEDGEESSAAGGEEVLRRGVVSDLLALLQSRGQTLPPSTVQTVVWVLGEYGYLAEGGRDAVIDTLIQWTDRLLAPATKAHIATALLKLLAMSPLDRSVADRLVRATHVLQRASKDLDLCERCEELRALVGYWLSRPDSQTVFEVLPIDASCEDLEVDASLSFLQGYVDSALLVGASPYHPPSHTSRPSEEGGDRSSRRAPSTLNTTPYKPPPSPSEMAAAMQSLRPDLAPALAPVVMGDTDSGPRVSATTVSAHSMQGNQLLTSPAARSTGVIWNRNTQLAVPTSIAYPSITSASTTKISPDKASKDSSKVTTSEAIYGTSGRPADNLATPIAVATNVPREPTEREKMAAALFGAPAPRSGTAGPVKGKAATHPLPAQSKSIETDLSSTVNATALLTLGSPSSLSGSSPTQSNTSTLSASASTDALLLDLTMPFPAVTPIPTPTVIDLSPPGLQSEFPPHAAAPTSSTHVLKTSVSDAFADLAVDSLSLSLDRSSAMDPIPTSRPPSLSPLPTTLLPHSPVPSSPLTLVPLPLTTVEFGQRWGAHKHEVKRRFPTALTSLTQLTRAVPSSLHQVEAIAVTSEAIFAAATGPPTDSSPANSLLVHLRLVSGALSQPCLVDLTLRAVDRGEADEAANLLLGHLTEVSTSLHR